jgi:hypothetical protein
MDDPPGEKHFRKVKGVFMKKLLVVLCIFFVLSNKSLAAPPAIIPNPVTLTDFKLAGDLSGDGATFVLSAVAHVKEPHGGSISLISGNVALTAFQPQAREHIRACQNQFDLDFDRSGDFPIQVKFTAAVKQNDDWKNVEFHVAPSVLEPISLHGLPADTKFQFAGAARPDREGGDFVSYLPADGTVKFSWKEVRPETEGKLFFSAGMLSQVSVSPGLMSQVDLLNFKIMQGELDRVSLWLHGEGEVTRVQGDAVLAWNVEPIAGSPDRWLVVQLNQPQKDQFAIQVQAQTPLGAFPQTADLLQLQPEKATQFAGYLRLVNQGAVRLEVVKASGTSQISPEQFPESDATRAAFRAEGNQRFAYRFAGANFALRIQADQILPELAVSEVLGYFVGENELALEANIELDIREAPLRELFIRVPKGYAVARLNASGLNDYFLAEPAGSADAELRLVFGQPISGRQLVDLRLEHNQGVVGTNWTLPRLEVEQAKSVRGFVGVAAEAGFRLTPERTKSLTEIATAFFPGKMDGLQSAFRLSDPAWEGSLRVERLPQTVQAGALHLFSIGEGIAYGSSVINYVVSGAPVSAFKIELSDEYYNVEFTGKDLRNWQKTDGGYLVQLHTPVSGAYTLLATYERPFKPHGETLAFTGARPADAQSEDGYTIITSAYQFDVQAADVSPGLLPLEPGEVPAEYRLFFDAPVLAAYRYAARPFNLKLSLNPLAQGDSLNQIVDRAMLDTRISKEGQVITGIRYFVKNRGNPDFRLAIPDGTQLWSATVNGAATVPVQDGKSTLIPLPQSSDPNAVLELDLKLATQSTDPNQIHLAAPTADAPVMLAQWKLEPDTGQRLVYRSGSLMPVGGAPDNSGFAQMVRLFSGDNFKRALTWLIGILVLAATAAIVWRRAAQAGLYRSGAAAVLVLFASLLLCLMRLAGLAEAAAITIPTDLTFLAPVQQAGTALTVAVSNIADQPTGWMFLRYSCLALAALALWTIGFPRFKTAAAIGGWLLLAWAALGSPNGVPALFWILFAFLVWQVVIPVLIQLARLPRGAAPMAAASASTALIVGGLLWLGCGATTVRAAESDALPESVTQTIRVEDKFALVTATIHWQAAKGDTLPLLAEPAVLTRVNYSTRSLDLIAGVPCSKYSQQLIARNGGIFDIEVQYELPIDKDKQADCFNSPVPYGLINRINLTVVGLDVDIASGQAVSIHCDHTGTNTVATLVLSPAQPSLSWHPRSRDVRHEKPVFYADFTQLYVPMAGVIEGAHTITIRPAQGELEELTLNVPKGATITDVTSPGASMVSLWRFDPDTRKLRVTLNPAQSRTFGLQVRSQIAAGPLPFDQSTGLITVDNSAGQIGLAGIATSSEVQLDTVTPQFLSPINLEDFSAEAVPALQSEIPGLTLHRAFRYSDTNASLSLHAVAVEPDVRVETDDTLSLGEDRTVLADNFTADITRAGIFELSFVMPAGFDIESISSPALSQWTELKTDAGRVITLHLTGKTLGQQSFALALSGPGVKTAKNYSVPQIVVREATKQRGSLLVVPEQGMRLQVGARDGYTQLDPQKSGIQQKGVLAFRVLEVPATLALDIEQVDPWVQVTSLQHATISEAQIKVTANLQYQIENTGLKAFHILVPDDAEGVQFQGPEVADFLQTGDTADGHRTWEVKLTRRFIGQCLLQVTYQIPLATQARTAILRSVQAADVNLQRGFVTVQSDPRLQITVNPLPEALQPTEWQSIPAVLQKDLQAVAANYTWRLVEPSFQIPLDLERHPAAKLLPAHVNNITCQSVISDDGVMLTCTRLEILPGDKRLLSVMLPADARFWFAFVNDSAVWPWRDGDKILIPLEQQASGDKPVSVEVFHSCQTGHADVSSLDLDLLAPKFDLPLENITWKLALGDKWRIRHWAGSLQLQEQEATPPPAQPLDTQSYLQTENNLQNARTAEAQQYFAAANNSLQNGDPEQARHAFENAYALSTQDPAFNEDARVQLHNIKLQQALIGLNSRQSAAAGDTGALGTKLRDLRNRNAMNYTQQDAKDIIDINTADDNAAFMRLAEKLIQQQDAAVSSPTGIRASIPEQGRVLVFKRAVAVEPWADLRINLQARVTQTASIGPRLLTLGVILAFLCVFGMGIQIKQRS